MMFKQIGETLSEIDSIYSKLNQYYEKLDQHLNDELSREIVKYIKTRKQLFREMLKYYNKAGNEEVLNSWIQFTPEYDLGQHIDIFKLDPNMDIEKVHEIVIQNENWLEEFYKYIVQKTSSTKTRELFQTILDRQIADTKSLASAIVLLQDI